MTSRLLAFGARGVWGLFTMTGDAAPGLCMEWAL